MYSWGWITKIRQKRKTIAQQVIGTYLYYICVHVQYIALYWQLLEYLQANKQMLKKKLSKGSSNYLTIQSCYQMQKSDSMLPKWYLMYLHLDAFYFSEMDTKSRVEDIIYFMGGVWQDGKSILLNGHFLVCGMLKIQVNQL